MIVINGWQSISRVVMDEIKQAVDDICEVDTDFKMTKSAEEYYESKRLQGNS